MIAVLIADASYPERYAQGDPDKPPAPIVPIAEARQQIEAHLRLGTEFSPDLLMLRIYGRTCNDYVTAWVGADAAQAVGYGPDPSEKTSGSLERTFAALAAAWFLAYKDAFAAQPPPTPQLAWEFHLHSYQVLVDKMIEIDIYDTVSPLDVTNLEEKVLLEIIATSEVDPQVFLAIMAFSTKEAAMHKDMRLTTPLALAMDMNAHSKSQGSP